MSPSLVLTLALRIAALFLALTCNLFATNAEARQCNGGWHAAHPTQYPNGPVYAMTTYDPDGPGPLSERIAVGGQFSIVGLQAQHPNLMLYDPATSTWSRLREPVATSFLPSGVVYALAKMPNGDLIAGGNFGGNLRSIARWNRTAWSDIGSGLVSGSFFGDVYALAVLPNGDLIAAGRFDRAGSTVVSNIARWNGSQWTPLGDGFNSTVYALLVLPNGEIIAGGAFTSSGSVSCRGVARWDGVTWSPLGSGTSGVLPTVHSLSLLPSGEVVCAGRFTSAGGVQTGSVAIWNGTEWSALPDQLGTAVFAVAVHPDGRLFATGTFESFRNLNRIAEFRDNRWQPVQCGLGTSFGDYGTCLLVHGHELFVGGIFGTTCGVRSIGFIRLSLHDAIPYTPLTRISASLSCDSRSLFIDSQPQARSPLSALWQWRETGCDPTCEWQDVVAGANTSVLDQTALFQVDNPTSTRLFGDFSLAARSRRRQLDFRCALTNACGGVTTSTTSVILCNADFSCNGQLTIDDIFLYANAWMAADPRADMDRSGLNLDDLFVFLNLWFAGCW